MGRVVVLDLDRTLVHTLSYRNPLYHSFYVRNVGWCHLRPFVRTFLRALRRQVTLVIWTAGIASYALDVTYGLMKHARMNVSDFAHILSRDDLVYREGQGWVKDLRVVRELTGASDVMLLDDDPVHQAANPRCVTIVPMFDATSSYYDSALCYLAMQTTSMSTVTRRPQVGSTVRQFFTRIR